MISFKPFILLLLLAASSCIFGQDNAGNKYETAEYKITFPAQPTLSTQKLPSSIGELLLTISAYEPKDAVDENLAYLIMETDYPDSTVHSGKTELLDKFFRGAIDGAITSVNGKLISESTIMVGMYPGRSIEINLGDGQAIVKMMMVLREKKMIMVQTVSDTGNYPNNAINSFFNSFNLKK